tara:strand:+ start:499 stop:1683 length:1185 start_codon:yes stop_codon:yes gene_type:complete
MANIKNKFTQPLSTEFSPKDLVVDIKNGHLYYKSNLGVHKLIGDNLSTNTKDERGYFAAGIEVVGDVKVSGSDSNEGGQLTLLPKIGGGYTWNVDNYQENFRLFTEGTETAVRMQISSSGYIGMGTTTPDQHLHIKGGTSPQILIEESTNEFVRIGVENTGGDMCLGWDDEDDMHFGVFSSITNTDIDTKMTIEGATGHVGIGIVNPSSRLHVVNSVAPGPVVKFKNTSTTYDAAVLALHIGRDGTGDGYNTHQHFIGFYDGADDLKGRIYAITSGIEVDDSNSDRRLKCNIKDSTRLGIDTLMKLRMVDYKYIKSPDKVYTSVIAQECKEVYPDAVSDYEEENIAKGLKWGDDGYTPMFIKSNKFIPLLLTAVQDQQKIIENLKARIEKIENN